MFLKCQRVAWWHPEKPSSELRGDSEVHGCNLRAVHLIPYSVSRGGKWGREKDRTHKSIGRWSLIMQRVRPRIPVGFSIYQQKRPRQQVLCGWFPGEGARHNGPAETAIDKGSDLVVSLLVDKKLKAL